VAKQASTSRALISTAAAKRSGTLQDVVSTAAGRQVSTSRDLASTDAVASIVGLRKADTSETNYFDRVLCAKETERLSSGFNIIAAEHTGDSSFFM